jgi:hypothetical protein
MVTVKTVLLLIPCAMKDSPTRYILPATKEFAPPI